MFVLIWLTTISLLPWVESSRAAGGGRNGPNVTLQQKNGQIILENGITQLILSNPEGMITSISYGGLDNWLETLNSERDRGYWDLSWSFPESELNFDVPLATGYRVIQNDGNKVEVSFIREYDALRSPRMVPLNVDKRFALLRGNSGFYSYAIYHKKQNWPAFHLVQARLAFKLRSENFKFMAVSDTIQRIMPSAEDRSRNRSQVLAYPEAVLLTNPENPLVRGEVDDKYQYTADNKDGRVHGWVSFEPLVGFWIIIPSNEYQNGGPTKQNLRCHTGPTCVSMFQGGHYAARNVSIDLGAGEAWKKVFGPVFIYLNSAEASSGPRQLWEDAKEQMSAETNAWPYEWPASADFLKPAERGAVTGRLWVQDKYISEKDYPASLAFVGLARPGEAGYWQTESKGYQFWCRATDTGFFKIKGVRPGIYDLYGFVPGVLGDYKKHGGSILVQPGSSTPLGDLVFIPPRKGPTVWEIGVPERTAAHFYIPEPDPRYINKVFLKYPAERYRQYGLWRRYSDLYPKGDLVYTVGKHNWTTDWYYMHSSRFWSNGTVSPTTWEVKFWLNSLVQATSPYQLRIAVAAAHCAALQVRVNDHSPLFDTNGMGQDNAIARHGIHGLYMLWNVGVPASQLKRGENSVFLEQRKVATSGFCGVLYDYLRLEAPGP